MSDLLRERAPPPSVARLVFIRDTDDDDDYNARDARASTSATTHRGRADDARRCTTRFGRGRHRASLVANAPPRETTRDVLARSIDDDDDVDARADAYVPKWWTSMSSSDASDGADATTTTTKSKKRTAPSRSNAALALSTTHVLSGDVNAACRRAYTQVLSDADPSAPVFDVVADVERRFGDASSSRCHATASATTLGGERATFEVGSAFRTARGVEFTQQMKTRLDAGALRAMVPAKVTIAASWPSSLKAYDAFAAMHGADEDDRSGTPATATATACDATTHAREAITPTATGAEATTTHGARESRTSTTKLTYAYEFATNSPRATLTTHSKPGKRRDDADDRVTATTPTTTSALEQVLSTIEVQTRVSSDVFRTHAARAQCRARFGSTTTAKATTKANVNTKGVVATNIELELERDIAARTKMTTSMSFPSRACALTVRRGESSLEAKVTSKDAAFGARHRRGKRLDVRFGVKRTRAASAVSEAKTHAFVAVAFAFAFAADAP